MTASGPGFTTITDLRLRRNGSVAWIAMTPPLDVIMNPSATPQDFLPNFEVAKVERGGRTLLDNGKEIAPGSLRVRGRAVSWVRAGQPYSASLD